MRIITMAVLAGLALTACDAVIGETGADGGSAKCSEGEHVCSGSNRENLQVCQGGALVHKETCVSPRACSAKLGRCADCIPGISACKGDDVHECTASGTLGGKLKTCPAGTCIGGLCDDPCTKAKEKRSYVGCSYWPTVSINGGVVEDFSFAVAVANTWSTTAKVSVSSSSATLASITVAPNSLATIKLPWVADLKQTYSSTTYGSVLKTSGAYHLVSSLPVTVYQFNALNYQVAGNCKKGEDDDLSDNKCFSYTNDASLLLPEHALAKEYMVVTRPTLGFYYEGELGTSPGFFSVVAPGAGSTKVTVTFTANTMAGTAGLAAYKQGQTATFTLSRWDVLQILSESPASCTVVKKDAWDTEFCDLSKTTDLTGTIVQSGQPVAVFAGHDCAFVPWDKWACDHLEEQMIPSASMGKQYVAVHTASSGKDPSIYRVVSASAGNVVRFDPPVHATVTLNKGTFVEITTSKDFIVSGSGRLAVAQFMVGQNYSNMKLGTGAPNDPAMALAVPVEQYRTSYRFLAPLSYQQNYVNVIAPPGATVQLNGAALAKSAFSPVGSSGKYTAAKVKIKGGTHTISSSAGFGITVYGVGAYTSYMYPGGLDLKALK